MLCLRVLLWLGLLVVGEQLVSGRARKNNYFFTIQRYFSATFAANVTLQCKKLVVLQQNRRRKNVLRAFAFKSTLDAHRRTSKIFIEPPVLSAYESFSLNKNK